MFSATVRCGMRWNAWKTMPMQCRRACTSAASPAAARSVPHTITCPSSGRSTPATRLRVVDFPHPDGPTSATVSPALMVKETPCSAWTNSSPRRYRLLTERSSVTISMGRVYDHRREAARPPLGRYASIVGRRRAITPLTLLLAGWVMMAVMMTVLWLVQRALRDAGVVDVGWAAGLGALAVLYAALAAGPPLRRMLVAAMAGTWSLRLASYILTNRVLGRQEDGRYQTLRSKWGERAQSRFFVFFQLQAVVDAVF